MSFNEDQYAHELLVRLRRGDNEALAKLYQYFFRVFLTFALRKGLTVEEAEDIAHDTFVRIRDHIYTYQEEEKGGIRWMWSICNRIVIDKLRANAREERRFNKELTDEAIEAIISREWSSEELNPVQNSAELEEQKRALRRVWMSISRDDQQIIFRRLLGRRGPPGKAYEEALKRLRVAFLRYYKDIE